MKDFDIYVIVVGLFLLAGYVSASGVSAVTTLLGQVEYVVLVSVIIFLALGGLVLKVYQNKSSRNQ
jgi:hypothetical protein